MKAKAKTTHTPGPWGWSRGLDGYPVVDTNVVGGPPLHIAKVGNFVMEASENEANARLIAAAPDLLETVKIAANEASYAVRYKHGESAADLSKSMHSILAHLTAAIAKAEGRE